MKQNPNIYLTPGEVAALFRVNTRTVTRWALAGKISVTRTPGGHRRFLRTEIHALLNEAEEKQAVERVIPELLG